MIETPRIIETAARPTAYVHLKVPFSEIRNEMGPALDEVEAALAAQGITPAGPWLTHHRQAPQDGFDVEVSVPTDRPVAPTGRVKAGELPAGKVARAVYRGGYEGLGDGWGELMDWIEAEGLKPAANLWEVYAVGPSDAEDEAAWQTELNRPLVG
jgi:effector-binding domain-containing protein